VATFLREFLSDPLVVDYPRWLWRPVLEHVVLRERCDRVAEMYRSIAGGDELPLENGTRAIANALQNALGNGVEVRAVYRYGNPSLHDALTSTLADLDADVVVVPLFPQCTSSSSETIVQAAVDAARAAHAVQRLRVIRIAPDRPAYVAAVGRSVQAAQAQAEIPSKHVVISFHGVPMRYDWRECGRYRLDCAATAGALRRLLKVPVADSTVCFQSRFGPEPWIGPHTFPVLRTLAQKGVDSVTVVMPGFLTDGLETLEEIGMRGRRAFLEAGGKSYVVARPAGVDPWFIASLAQEIASVEHVRSVERVAHAV
jgi:ferrochelatase